MDLIEIIKDLDLPIAITVMLILWRIWHKESLAREERMAKRLDEQNDKNSTILVEAVNAIRKSYQIDRRVGTAVEDLVKALGARPCLSEDSFYPHPSVHAAHSLPRAGQPSGETTKPTHAALNPQSRER